VTVGVPTIERAEEPVALSGGDLDAPRKSPIPFLPGLEGLRGVALAAVLFFHGGFSWAKGGFLGVSTFFTLSGFLITMLLIWEFSTEGRIRLRRFWGRRYRRLMPASLLCLTGVVVFGWLVATPGQLVTLRGDVLASLLYVANWRFIVTQQSYAQVFSAPSPVLHFWSLAIEEQFYLVFPLVVAAVLALAHGSRRALGAVLTVLAVGSLGLMWVLYTPGQDPSRVYYGTGTRAFELLLGALLAIVLSHPAGLVLRIPRWAWALAGVHLDHYTGFQYAQTTHIAVADLLPGDLVFFWGAGETGDPGHVGLYIGNGLMVHAPHEGGNVMLSSIYYWPSGTFSASRVTDPASPPAG